MDPRQQRRTLWSTLLGVFVTAWPSVILVASLPAIAEDLGTDTTTLAWVITLPTLVASVLLPTLGRIGDLHGHRKVFLFGLGGSIVTAGLTALAWDAASLITFRTISQVVGVGTMPAAIALIMDAFPPTDRAKALGLWSSVTAASPTLGLVFGGPLVGAVGWRGVFVIQAIAAASFFPACIRWLKETPKNDNVGFDVLGGIALMIASGSVLFLFDRAAEWGWGHPVVLLSGLVFPFAAYAFVRIERRATDPLLPPSLLRTRAYAAPLGGELLAQLAANGAFFITPILLNQVFGLSVAQTAWMMVPLPLGMAVGSPVGGRMTVRIGERASGMIGATGIATAMALFLTAYLTEALPVVLAALLVMGLAHGFIRPSTASAAGAALEPEFFGVGMATMRMTSQLGGAAGISLAVTTEALGGFSATFATELVLAVAAIAVMGLVISQARPTTRAQRVAAEELVETENALTTMPAMEA